MIIKSTYFHENIRTCIKSKLFNPFIISTEMEAKEIKSALKEAREAIKSKDYKSSLKICKGILKADRNNYMALVLFGVALQETEQKDQAPNAFRKAIEVSPKQILAWQGLASYYEKEPSPSNGELFEVYQELLLLESDTSKYKDICNKLAELTLRTKKDDLFADILVYQGENVADNEKKGIVWRIIATVISQVSDPSSKALTAMEKALHSILKEDTSEESVEFYKKYLKLLYKINKFKELINEAINMHFQFPQMEYPLEWICKVYSEEVTKDKTAFSYFQDKIDDYVMKLQNFNASSGLALLAKAAHLYQLSQYLEALDHLRNVLGLMPNSCYVYALLCFCYSATYSWVDSEFCAKEALNKLPKLSRPQPDLERTLNNSLAKSLCMQSYESKWEEAIDLCKMVITSNPNSEILTILGRCHVLLQQFQEVEKCANDMEQGGHKTSSLLILALSLKSQGKFEDAEKLLHEAISLDPSKPELWFELGKSQWERGHYDESLVSMLKATKLDPSNYYCFVYLGNYYSMDGRDMDKARRCYQKAFQINPKGEEAGIGLSDTYRCQGFVDLNLQILRYVTDKAGCGSAKWAWLRLGLLLEQQNKVEEAINCLRVAIRIDPSDSNCWESLADAYQNRGSFNSALKCYERVLELCPDALYPAYQVAAVNRIVGLYTESVEQYKAVLSANPTYVPALHGLGETSVHLARTYLSQQLLGRCRDTCQEAVDCLIKAAEEYKNLTCLWKLIGDACNIFSSLPTDLCNLNVKSWLVNADPALGPSDESTITLNKEGILQLGARCYCRALSLSSGNSLMWHDLAVNYSCQADNASSKSAKKDLRNWALTAAKKAVTINPQSWRHWNLLGVVAASQEVNNLKLAQHSFIKSIEVDRNNAIHWTNLGTLYLSLNELRLANKAFGQAQRVDPDYMECWIGQALVAEKVGHYDAMDLFRHTTVLGVHPESCIGYSNWVCSSLMNTKTSKDAHYIYNIEKMHALPVAGDAMTWYTGVIKNNACAYNMLGLLMERQQIYNLSKQAFKNAYELLFHCEDSEERDLICNNYGRLLVHLQDYDKAIEVYKQIKKATFKSQSGLAVAYFKAEKYEESYETYESILHWLAPDDGLKSHILVAMAAMQYKLGMLKESKDLLMQCVSLKPPSVYGLFALCSFGMLNNDLSLSEAVIKELLPYKDNEDYMTHIAVFNAYLRFIQKRSVESVRSLTSMVHRHPSQASMWLSLALLLLNMYSVGNTEGAAHCAQVAMFLGRSTMDVSKVMSLVSLGRLLSGQALSSLRSSQKAVHMFPDIPENWVVLIASFLPYCLDSSSVSNSILLNNLIGHVRRKMESSRQMTKWLSNYNRKVSLLAEQC